MHSKVDQEGAQLGTGNLDGAFLEARARLGRLFSTNSRARGSLHVVSRSRAAVVCTSHALDCISIHVTAPEVARYREHQSYTWLVRIKVDGVQGLT